MEVSAKGDGGGGGLQDEGGRWVGSKKGGRCVGVARSFQKKTWGQGRAKISDHNVHHKMTSHYFFFLVVVHHCRGCLTFLQENIVWVITNFGGLGFVVLCCSHGVPEVPNLFPKMFPIAPQFYLIWFAQSSTLMYIN
jgi:hypothetical protein